MGTKSDFFKEKAAEIDDISARISCRVNKLNREPSEIDHIAKVYQSAFPQMLNGETQGIHVREEFRDNSVQCLYVNFGQGAFSPAHRHPHYCVCEVISGTIYDGVNGKKHETGDWYFTGKDEVHSAHTVSPAVLRVYNTEDELLAREILSARKYIKRDKLKIKTA